MRLTRVPGYTVTELEQRAEGLLRDRCGWPPPIPVDIELLVDLEAGVVLDILPGLQDLCGVAGLVRYEPKQGRMRIVIDADTQKVERAMRQRFTILE